MVDISNWLMGFFTKHNVPFHDFGLSCEFDATISKQRGEKLDRTDSTDQLKSLNLTPDARISFYFCSPPSESASKKETVNSTGFSVQVLALTHGSAQNFALRIAPVRSKFS